MQNVRSYRGAEMNSDYILLRANVAFDLKSREKPRRQRERAINIEAFSQEELKVLYQKVINESYKMVSHGSTINERWSILESRLKKAAVNNVGNKKRKIKESQFNTVWKKHRKKAQEARQNMLQTNSSQDIFYKDQNKSERRTKQEH